MKFMRKLRRSAYLVDFILLIVALIAIAGLASLVHIRANKTPHETAKQTGLELAAQHIDALDLANTSPQPSPSNNPGSAASSQLQPTAILPETGSMASACKDSCDTAGLSTPKAELPAVGLTVQPISVTVKPKTCDNEKKGLISGAVNSLLRPECLL